MTINQSQRAEQIITHYEELTLSAQRLMSFQGDWVRSWLEHNHYPPAGDSRRSFFRSFWGWLISPLQIDPRSSRLQLSPIAPSIFLIELYALLFGVSLLLVIADISPPPSSSNSSPSSATWLFYGLIACLHLSLLIVSVVRAHRVFFSGRLSRRSRLVVLLIFSGTLLLAGFIPAYWGNWWGLSYGPVALDHLTWRYSQAIWIVVLNVLFILAPAIWLLLVSVLDAGIWAIWMLQSISGHVVAFHNPLPIKDVERLTTELVFPESSGPQRRLIDLSLEEVTTLQDWARTNREGTEKRLIPAAISLSALQLIGWGTIAALPIWQTLNSSAQNLYASLSGPSSISPLPYLPMAALVGVIAGFLIAILDGYMALLFNLAVQSLISEACLVAGFAIQTTREAEKTVPTDSPEPTPFEQLIGLLKWLSKFFR